MIQEKKKTAEISEERVETLRETQMATLNILEDFNAEKLRLEETQRAVLNILDDFNTEKSNIEKTQRATFNLLEDFNAEKSHLERTQRATFNILEDFNADRLRLQDTQKALLNILDDLNQSGEELQKAHDVLEIRVKERTAELARSNAELEQFAYIASHDLQEPLRADEFIGYASDGALRMQRLINDLLAYSRVGTRGKSFEAVNLEMALAQAVENLQLAIKEKNAIVTHDPLPITYGDIGQLTQVFQNLIDNAIKFRGEEPPKVHISARLEGDECVCSVEDNGIGIAPEYLNKVFLLFQRLHARKEYPGTGIGLAICKRIVERHGGGIWVESSLGKGSTFHFKIPTTRKSYYNE